MSLNPDGVPVSGDLATDSLCSFSVSSSRTSAIDRIAFCRSSCATSSTDRSARSTRSRAGASRDSTLAWISYDVVSSARIWALSRTIRPYSRAWPAAGTQPASSSIASAPPTSSSLPCSRSASATVSGSILLSLSCSAIIAANTAPCCSR